MRPHIPTPACTSFSAKSQICRASGRLLLTPYASKENEHSFYFGVNKGKHKESRSGGEQVRSRDPSAVIMRQCYSPLILRLLVFDTHIYMGVTHFPHLQAPVTAVAEERQDPTRRESVYMCVCASIYIRSHGREEGSVHRCVCVAY